MFTVIFVCLARNIRRNKGSPRVGAQSRQDIFIQQVFYMNSGLYNTKMKVVKTLGLKCIEILNTWTWSSCWLR